MTVNESIVQTQVADYLLLQYPDVLFHSDFGSSVGMTAQQGARKRRQNGGRRGWPDMVIAEAVEARPVFEDPYWNNVCRDWDCFFGLYIELKKDGETLYPGPRAKKRFQSKDGKEYKTEHLMEQADCLYDLRQRGYCAEFAIGFDEAKQIIDKYLGGPQQRKVEF